MIAVVAATPWALLAPVVLVAELMVLTCVEGETVGLAEAEGLALDGAAAPLAEVFGLAAAAAGEPAGEAEALLDGAADELGEADGLAEAEAELLGWAEAAALDGAALLEGELVLGAPEALAAGDEEDLVELGAVLPEGELPAGCELEVFVEEFGALDDVLPEVLPCPAAVVVEPLWLPPLEEVVDVLVLLLGGAAGGILLTETEAEGDWLPLLLPELELVCGEEELLWLAVEPELELEAGPSATAVETGSSTSAAIVSRLAAIRWGIRLRTDPRRQARRSGRAGSVIYSLSLRQNCRRPTGLPAVPR